MIDICMSVGGSAPLVVTIPYHLISHVNGDAVGVTTNGIRPHGLVNPMVILMPWFRYIDVYK